MSSVKVKSTTNKVKEVEADVKSVKKTIKEKPVKTVKKVEKTPIANTVNIVVLNVSAGKQPVIKDEDFKMLKITKASQLKGKKIVGAVPQTYDNIFMDALRVRILSRMPCAEYYSEGTTSDSIWVIQANMPRKTGNKVNYTQKTISLEFGALKSIYPIGYIPEGESELDKAVMKSIKATLKP